MIIVVFNLDFCFVAEDRFSLRYEMIVHFVLELNIDSECSGVLRFVGNALRLGTG
jgi:hypothetical protein